MKTITNSDLLLFVAMLFGAANCKQQSTLKFIGKVTRGDLSISMKEWDVVTM